MARRAAVRPAAHASSPRRGPARRPVPDPSPPHDAWEKAGSGAKNASFGSTLVPSALVRPSVPPAHPLGCVRRLLGTIVRQPCAKRTEHCVTHCFQRNSMHIGSAPAGTSADVAECDGIEEGRPRNAPARSPVGRNVLIGRGLFEPWSRIPASGEGLSQFAAITSCSATFGGEAALASAASVPAGLGSAPASAAPAQAGPCPVPASPVPAPERRGPVLARPGSASVSPVPAPPVQRGTVRRSGDRREPARPRPRSRAGRTVPAISPAFRERPRVVTARGRHGGPDRSAANDGECTIGTTIRPDNGTGGILNIGYCNGLIRSRDRYAGVMKGMTE